MNQLQVFGLVALLGVGLTGCATSAMERQERSVDSVAETRTEMADMHEQIERTMGSLNALMAASPGDLRKAYQRYVKDVNAMRSQAANMQKHASAMERQSGNYLAGWQRTQSEIVNPELRELTAQRRELIANSFSRIRVAFREADRELGPFLARLEDIRRAIGNDLTPVGVASVAQTDAVTSVNALGASVGSALQVAIAEFDQLVGTMAASPH